MAGSTDGTKRFFEIDYPRTLFPLKTNRIIIEHAAQAINEYIYDKILKETEKEYAFLAQQRVYAAKPGYHLRRTVKLDPVAEYFLYDVVYRNRALFRKSPRKDRRSFGYRFVGGEPISGTDAHAEFQKALAAARDNHAHMASFDIASYFNSLYHHDLVPWMARLGASTLDTDAFSQFLREINSGRSIDCLPHGLYPAKMIGNDFLHFLDTSSRLRSKTIIRFMDDYHLFDDSESVLIDDFMQAQKLLGDKGLSVNPRKTRAPGPIDDSPPNKVDAFKATLLKMRRSSIMASGADDDGESDEQLTGEQREYLLSILKEDTMAEEDAELALVLMRPYPEDVLQYLPAMLAQFPNITKELHGFCAHVEDRDALTSIVLNYLKEPRSPSEYQLFWLGKIAEDFLLESPGVDKVLMGLMESDGATPISKAKVLEIPEQRFGMPELREEHLKTGQSDWLSWSAAAGTRLAKKSTRNWVLKYFSKGSPMNFLIGSCIDGMKDAPAATKPGASNGKAKPRSGKGQKTSTKRPPAQT